MDKSIFKRSFSLMIAVLMTLGVFCLSLTFADAESGIEEYSTESATCTFSIPEIMWKGQNKAPVSVFTSDNTKVTVKSVSSSDKSVAKVVKSGKDYLLEARKPGTSTITVKYKLKTGESGTHIANTTVKPYPNQIKSLKLDGKAIKIKKHKYSFVKSKGYKNTKVKVKMALKDGWKISSAWGYRYKGSTPHQVNISKKILENGTAIKFPKKYKRMYISIYMQNEKKETIRYDVDLNR